MPPERALEELKKVLKENDDAVAELRGMLSTEAEDRINRKLEIQAERTRRAFWGGVVAFLIVVLVLGLSLWNNHVSSTDACDSRNHGRVDVMKALDTTLNLALEASKGQPNHAQAVVVINGIERHIHVELRPLAC